MAVDTLYRVVTEAIDDILEHGFDSQARVDRWMERIQLAAHRAIDPLDQVQRELRDLLLKIFERTVRNDRLMRRHRGISRFTLEQIKPKLRAELDRRIEASADLIKLHREESMAATLRRFAGWATSIPAGGTDVARRSKVKKEVRKGIAGLPYESRRVIIDQGHKLVAAVNEIVAVDGGAIAGRWVSHWREAGYDYRPEHKARDNKVFLVRGSWAMKDGLVKLAGHEYTDQIEQPSQLPYCRCYYEFLYTLRDLPAQMLTVKGREKLQEVRERLRDFPGAVL